MGQLGFWKQSRRLATCHHLRMLCRIAFWPHRIVSCFNNRLATFVHNQRTKGMASIAARFACQLDCAPKAVKIFPANPIGIH
jgi:hypothetical protein